MDIAINWWAVLTATVSNIVIGFMWYGPIFGRTWVREMGFTKEWMDAAQGKNMNSLYIAALVGAFIMSFVLKHFVEYVGAVTAGDAVTLAFWVWLGFYATSTLSQVLWEGKSKKLYALNIGYYWVTLTIATLILTVWN